MFAFIHYEVESGTKIFVPSHTIDKDIKLTKSIKIYCKKI